MVKKVNNIVVHQESKELPRMPVFYVQGHPICIDVELVFGMNAYVGGEQGAMAEFLFKAVRYYVFMLESAEALENGEEEPSMRDTPAEVKKGMYKYTNGDIEIISDFVNEALEEFFELLASMGEQPTYLQEWKELDAK